MLVSIPQRRSIRQRGRRLAFQLDLEALETRTVPSVNSWPGLLNPVSETEPNDTLDRAQSLGDLTTAPRAEVIGTIRNDAAGGGVDWYRFQLDRAADVRVVSPKASNQSHPVTALSLYNTDSYDWNDPYNLLGYRPLAQADSATQGGTAQIDRRLAPGTYYVAVSGSGNHYFQPFLADSGYAGATGDYGLLITASDLGFGLGDGPAVLAADPNPGAILNRSPFLIRVDVSGALDPGSVSPGGTVELLSNAQGTFGDGNDQVVGLASVNLNSDGTELLIAPAAPLPPSYYKVVLAGDSSANAQVLTDLNGIALGTNRSHPSGADFSYTFHINGNEGNTTTGSSADDTPATSHQLGDLTQVGFVQIAGAIGDDSTDPVPFNGSDVDLYHFRVSGSERYLFTAEVFASRIGSPLGGGVSLFQASPTTGQLTLVTSNAGTHNDVVATDGSRPLYSDPALFAGLQAGDYYVAVSSYSNVPDLVNYPPGTNGVFDPNVSHSGQNSGPAGDYILNLQLQPRPNPQPPQVVAATPSEGATFTAPPTSLTIQFSEPMNLPQLAQVPVHDVQGTLAGVYVLGSDGTKYYPRLDSYDRNTNQATFLMLDALRNDTYQLHLSGSLGVADLVGDALVGNDASGDYVVDFTVNGPARGTGSNPLLWSDQEPNDDLGHPQDLGVLFRNEMETGVTLQRDFTQDPASAPADTADTYRFQVLQLRGYVFNFTSASLPSGVQATLFDVSGTAVPVSRQPYGDGFSAYLQPGAYVLKVGDWATCQAAGLNYSIVIRLASSADNPVALTTGPAPVISIQLATDVPPTPPTTALVVTPPPTLPPAVVTTAPSPASSNPTTPTVTSSTATGVPATPLVTATVQPTPMAQPAALPPSPPTTTATSSQSPNPVTAGMIGDAPVVTVATNVVPSAPTPAQASPVPAGGSVVVLVHLVAPAGANNVGITPALLRLPSERPVELVGLPSGTLLALGAAPMGGIKDSSLVESPRPSERVLVQLPEPLSSRQLQIGTVVFPKTDSGTNEVDTFSASSVARLDSIDATASRALPRTERGSGDLGEHTPGMLSAQLSPGIRHLLHSSSATALDAFFGIARWLEETALQTLTVPSSREDLPSQDESAEFESRGDTLRPVAVQVPSAPDRILVNGLAVLAALAVARSDQKRKPDATDPRSAMRCQPTHAKAARPRIVDL